MKNFKKNILRSKENHEYEDNSPLCLCEYYNTKNERSHILFCCCNCEAVDSICTNLICCDKNNESNELIHNALDDIQDRLRVPCPGGAQKLDLDLLVSIIAICVIIFIGTINLPCSILVVLLVPVLLYLRFFNQRLNKSIRRITIAYYMSLLGMIITFILFNTHIQNELDDNIYMNIYKLAFLTLIIFHLSLHYSNPGKVLQQNKTLSGFNRCNKCSIVKSNESTGHCNVCDYCIIKRDHHCFWIDNCIGNNNHRLFILYLLYMQIFFIYSFNLLYYNVKLSTSIINFRISLMRLLLVQLIPLISFTFFLLFQQFLFISCGYTQYELVKMAKANYRFSLLLFIYENFNFKAMLKNWYQFIFFRSHKKNNLNLLLNV